MKPKQSVHKSKQRDLFRPELTKIIDHGHGLVKLAKAVDWNRIDAEFTERYCPGNGRPTISTRLMVSLQYLLADTEYTVTIKQSSCDPLALDSISVTLEDLYRNHSQVSLASP